MFVCLFIYIYIYVYIYWTKKILIKMNTFFIIATNLYESSMSSKYIRNDNFT